MVDGGVSLFDVQDYLRRPIPVDENAFEDIKASESVPEVALETNFDTSENPDIELTGNLVAQVVAFTQTCKRNWLSL